MVSRKARTRRSVAGPWFSPSAQIEDETRIAYRFPPETGWCGLAPIQELLNFTQ